MVIQAKEGYTFIRKHDGFKIGDKVTLGFDYSTGVKRQDKKDYYKEIKKESEGN